MTNYHKTPHSPKNLNIPMCHIQLLQVFVKNKVLIPEGCKFVYFLQGFALQVINKYCILMVLICLFNTTSGNN